MTKDALNHPGDEALRALSLGQLAEAELVRICDHLNDCPDCCRRIDELDAEDRLLERLRHFAARQQEMLVHPDEVRSAARALQQSHDARSSASEFDPPGTENGSTG